MKVRNYTELFAWQRAMDLVLATYQSTKSFPVEELYALTKQLRRAVVSHPFQHRGRTGQTLHKGISSSPFDRLRIFE